MGETEIQTIKTDFQDLSDNLQVLAVLLFGSFVRGETSKRSDIDICVVLGEQLYDYGEILNKIWREVGGKYDVSIFEKLPINVQSQILEDYQIVICKDPPNLGEYLYPYYKKVNTFRQRLRVAYGTTN